MLIPEKHQTVMPYLIVDGADKFIGFTTAVFNAGLLARHMQPGSDRIMHAEIEIGGSTIMFADSNNDWPPVNANLFVYVESADESFSKALDNGAEMVMPLSDQDYGRTCGVRDPLGNTWWITSVISSPS